MERLGRSCLWDSSEGWVQRSSLSGHWISKWKQTNKQTVCSRRKLREGRSCIYSSGTRSQDFCNWLIKFGFICTNRSEGRHSWYLLPPWPLNRAIPRGMQGISACAGPEGREGVSGQSWRSEWWGGKWLEPAEPAVLSSSGAWQLWQGLYGTVCGVPQSAGSRVVALICMALPLNPSINVHCEQITVRQGSWFRCDIFY